MSDEKTTTNQLPLCWGHRGASATFPENTLASFEAAIRDGAEGIESDVHITNDDVILMFHDADLSRTTDGTGKINEQAYAENIDQLYTRQEPRQKIPTFKETIDLLMRPDCRHVSLNVDVKPENDPERLFKLIAEVVASHDEWETTLAPRIILGLWHPKFIRPANEIVPFLRRIFIGISLHLAQTCFWDDCDGFSIAFKTLITPAGQDFIRRCKDGKKHLYVWTVNRRDEMIEASRWGVAAVLTDRTGDFLNLRGEMTADLANVMNEIRTTFGWRALLYYTVSQWYDRYFAWKALERTGGPLRPFIRSARLAARPNAAAAATPTPVTA